MPSCERCWRDSRMADDSVAEYNRLIDERDCTPEQQAGDDSTRCPECERMTVHQYAHACMNCGWRPTRDESLEAPA